MVTLPPLTNCDQDPAKSHDYIVLDKTNLTFSPNFFPTTMHSAIDMACTAVDAKIRVAVAQYEPVWLDLPKSITKTCDLIRKAAQKGAKLVHFQNAGFQVTQRGSGMRSINKRMVSTMSS